MLAWTTIRNCLVRILYQQFESYTDLCSDRCIGGMLLGLIAAVLCNKAFPGIRVFSTSYALPMAIASSSAAMIFQIMLHPAVGIVNKLLGRDINWLNDPKYRTDLCGNPYGMAEQRNQFPVFFGRTWKH